MCSPYIEIESLTPVLSKYKSIFSVLSLNIQSLNSKFDTLLAILSDLNDNNIKIDAICLQETWLSNDQDASVFSIAGYQLIHLGKKCSSHSGLAIFLSDSFSYCPACRTTLVATRFRVAVICPIIQVPHCIRVFFDFV